MRHGETAKASSRNLASMASSTFLDEVQVSLRGPDDLGHNLGGFLLLRGPLADFLFNGGHVQRG